MSDMIDTVNFETIAKLRDELEAALDRIAELEDANSLVTQLSDEHALLMQTEDRLSVVLTKIGNVAEYLEQEANHADHVHNDAADRFDAWIDNGKRGKQPEGIVALPVAADAMRVAARSLRTTLYANGIKPE